MCFRGCQHQGVVFAAECVFVVVNTKVLCLQLNFVPHRMCFRGCQHQGVVFAAECVFVVVNTKVLCLQLSVFSWLSTPRCCVCS